MVRAVVDQVAALTEALEIARPVVARIVIEVGGGQDDASPSYPCHLLDIGPGGGSAMVVTPSMTGGVEPASIRQTANICPMRPAAALANPAGTLEARMPAGLRPVDRIEPAQFRSDRHFRFPSPGFPASVHVITV